eukprot:COSAG01_NODE_12333_length_1757_cov_4.785283_1_plen_189_part_00
MTRHSPHHSLQKRLQNSYFEGRDDACGRVMVVNTTAAAARCRAHGPPPCPHPFQPKNSPARPPPAPFTTAVMAVGGGEGASAARSKPRTPVGAASHLDLDGPVSARLREHNPEGTRTWTASAAELVVIPPRAAAAEYMARHRAQPYSEEVKRSQAQYPSVCGCRARGRSAAQVEWLQKKIREAQSNTN